MSAVPDLLLARRYLDVRAPPGTPLLLAVTGSHHYGFSSKDSDLDLKGIHAVPTETLLGLRPNQDAHDALEVFEGTECDLTTHEVAVALQLLLRGNGNILERIFSPWQVLPGPTVDELRVLGRGALSRRSIDHYGGYFRGMKREHEREPTVKSLLYTFRVALTGIHLLETGEVEANLPALLEARPLAGVAALVQRKIDGREKDLMTEAESAPYRALWPGLAQALEDAVKTSPLPEGPANTAAIEDWLKALRKHLLAS